jgi:hypothetical protein
MKLERDKKDLQNLAGRNKSQKGGAFLPLLLSTVLGGLSSIF